MQEVYALSALSVGTENIHIVRYYSGWIDDGSLHIVMELCKTSLRAFAKKKRNCRNNGSLEEATIRKVMRDVCLGLLELHGKGIVHLDIKPENILEGFSGKFKLGDLGLARLVKNLHPDDDIPEGDCRYLAKELLNDDPTQPIPDLTKADIFALGVTVYELIERKCLLFNIGADKELDQNGEQWQDLRDGLVVFSNAKAAYS